MLAFLLVVACHGGAPPTHYYAAGDGWAIYLAWTEDATEHLQGQVQVIAADPSDPAKLKSTSAPFTGIRNGSDISISFPLVSNYLGATWTGTLKGNAISLVIPTSGLPANPTLDAGSFEEFQKAAQKVQGKVNVAQQVQAQQQAAIAQQQAAEQAAAAQQFRLNQQKNAAYNSSLEAENHVRTAFAQVQNALTPLGRALQEPPSRFGLRAQYAAEWNKMGGTWAQEQAAGQVTPMTCYQKGQVTYIAGQITYENGEVKYLDSEARNLADSIQSSLNTASQGLDALSQWAPEYYRRAQAYSQLSNQPSNVPDPTNQLAAFRKQTEASISMYSARLESFEKTIANYDDLAQGLQDRAQAFPQSISCSG
ncbi:MAG TPA: hypothetical protein VGX91_12030 [Candidatus Cybelea sp.]|nr:hypothetical protein [Candidatus Cybelea sp.]